jgi:tetratricopeptide (TPR) repeat protein
MEMLRREAMESLDGAPVQDGHAVGGTDSTRVLNHFRQVLQLPQEDAEIASMCAAYMKLINMPQDTLNAMYYKVLEIEPDNSYARLQLVADAWSREDMPKVITLCSDARRYNPEEMSFYYYQGFAYYRQDDVDNALSAFQNGVSVITEESNPMLASDFYALLGHLLHKKGLEEEALAACDSCLQWNPDNIGCLNDYAYYLSERDEELDKAEMMSYRAIKAEPKNAAYLDTYAWILFRLERYAEAKIYMDQTLQCDPDPSAVLLEHAGDIYFHTGDKTGALDFWRQALDKSSADSEITGKRKTLLQKKIKLKKYIKQ